MPSDDPLIVHLRRLLPDQGIIAATTGVIEHFDLLDDGNRMMGKTFYVQSRAADRPELGDLRRGSAVRPGQREIFPHCELLCQRDGDHIIVMVVDRGGHDLSRRLSCPATEAEAYDEALFLWFGPQEYICSPWHDGDPERQVISVDGLRAYAAAWKPPQPSV